MAGKRTSGPAALVLTATVARRYYLDGATKSDIAAELGLSRFKVARLLDEARASGVVRIELDSSGQIDLDLSVRLAEAYGLRHCVVMDGPEDDEELLRTTLGRAAAELVTEIVEPGDVLGISWARSLVEMRSAVGPLARCDVVQLTGVLPLPGDDSPVELVRDVARRSEGDGYFYYAPMILPDAVTAASLRTQPEVARAVERFPDVTKAVVGVGAWKAGLSTVADAVTERDRRADARRRRAQRAVRRPARRRGNARRHRAHAAADRHRRRPAPRRAGGDRRRLRPGEGAAVRAAVRGGFVKSLVTHPAMAGDAALLSARLA